MNCNAFLKNWTRDSLPIPEGYNDGSLARSAWETHPGIRPVRVRYEILTGEQRTYTRLDR
jgi:hypothetical protein